MMRTPLFAVGLAATLSGCPNPAAEAPEAKVGEAREDKEAKRAETSTQTASKAPRFAAPMGDQIEVIDFGPGQAKVEFVGSKVTGSHRGGFERLKGTVYLDPNTLENSRIELDIDMTSLFSDKPKLSKHLASDDFFAVQQYPTARFELFDLKAIEEGEEGTHTMAGNLTLRGKTKGISFPATLALEDTKVSGKASFSINRKDFGIMYPGKPDDLIRDLVLIELSFAGKRPASS